MAPSPTGCPLAGGVEKSARASPGSIDLRACRSGRWSVGTERQRAGSGASPFGAQCRSEKKNTGKAYWRHSATRHTQWKVRTVPSTIPRQPSAPQCGINGASRPIAEWNAPAGGSCACRASADGGFALQTPPGLRPPPWDEPAKPASSDSEHSALSPASPTDAAGGDGGTATRAEPHAEPEPAASIEEGTSERRWRPHRCTRRHCVDGHVRLANTEVGQRMQQCLLAKPSQCRPS
jgi:hypothetical protein